MAGESLGTARLDLAVDTSGFEAAIERSKNIAASLGDAAASAFTKADSSAKKGSTSLIRWSELIGKSADEQKLLNAAIRGVPMEIINGVADRLNKVRQEAAAAAVTTRDLAAANAQAAEFAAAGAEAAKNDRLREQARVVAALTAQYHALEAAEKQEAEFALAAKTAAENDRLREQQRVVAVLTEQFHALEAAEAQVAAGSNFVASLQQQANAIGKTRSELLAMKAVELGVTEQAAPFIAKLREQEVALTNVGIAFNKYGLSAKQTQAALRQVPAQITDIFVSLQGGQNPLTVLLQQGGQLKDVFGGVRPALEALGGGLLRLINPVTLTVGALAGAIALFANAEGEVTAFNKALILSGDQSGRTADDLRNLAIELDKISGVTIGSATDAITAVVASGKIAVDQQKLVATAALDMERVTGKAVADTVAEFAELARDPVSAILKLNESQNFLSRSTLDQIELYVKQGEAAKAAALAQETYANTLIERTGAVETRLGTLEKAWKFVKESAKDAWDAMLNVGREDTLEVQLKQAEDRVARGRAVLDAALIRNNGKLAQSQLDYFNGAIANAEKQVKDLEARMGKATGQALKPGQARAQFVNSEQERIRIAAEKEFASLVQSNLSKEQALTAEITRIRELGRKAGKSEAEIEVQVAAARKKAAEQGAERGLGRSQARNDLAEFKATLEQEMAAINGQSQVLRAQYAARLVDATAYYAGLRKLATDTAAAQEKALLGQIAALKARSATGKDAVDIDTKIIELEAQLAKVRADSAVGLKVLDIEEQALNKTRSEAVQDYKDRLDESTEALKRQVNAEIAKVGMGQAEAQLQQQINDIYAEQADKLRDLNKQRERDPNFTADQYKQEVEALQQTTDEKVRIVQDGYIRMEAAQQDWLAGVRAGAQDWLKATSDVAGQMATITNNALNSAADAFSNFAMTGKFEMKELLRSILADLVKFFAKQAVMQFITAFLPGLGGFNFGGGGGGGFIFNANGNSFAGGTSLPTNTVLQKPTLFKFAKGGAFGVAGEAGPEAVMPLTRGPDGKLGVQASGGGGGGTVNISVSTVVNSDGSSKTQVKGDQESNMREFTERMKIIASEEVFRQMKPGGALYNAGVTVR